MLFLCHRRRKRNEAMWLHVIIGFILLYCCETSAYKLDRDTAEDCSTKVDTCRTSSSTFLECPVTCSESLEPPYPMVQGHANTPDNFYLFRARTAIEESGDGGEMYDFEELDGYMTILVATPMIPGMAQYYYEMAQALVAEDPFRTQCLIIPFVRTNSENEDQQSTEEVYTDDTLRLKMIEGKMKRCIVLETHRADEMQTHALIQYLDSKTHVRRQQPDEQIQVYNDKAVVYMINHDAALIERRVTPHYNKMKAVLKHYYKIMDREL